MRHLVLALLAGCAGTKGDPIGGDVAFTIDADTIVPTAGAAIADSNPMKQMIVLGTRDISCETTLGTRLQKGTYVTILIDRQPGMQPMAQISVIRVNSAATQINGAAGPVTIDELGDRVTGSLTFATTDDVDGTTVMLGVTGAFDVRNCSP